MLGEDADPEQSRELCPSALPHLPTKGSLGAVRLPLSGEHFIGGLMPRKCIVCTHNERAAIDSALIGEGTGEVSKRFGISRSALYRHRRHISAPVMKALQADATAAKDAEDIERGRPLLAKLGALGDKAEAIYARAERSKNWRTALGALKEMRGIIELAARMTGELNGAGDSTERIQPAAFVLPAGTIMQIALSDRDRRMLECREPINVTPTSSN